MPKCCDPFRVKCSRKSERLLTSDLIDALNKTFKRLKFTINDGICSSCRLTFCRKINEKENQNASFIPADKSSTTTTPFRSTSSVLKRNALNEIVDPLRDPETKTLQKINQLLSSLGKSTKTLRDVRSVTQKINIFNEVCHVIASEVFALPDSETFHLDTCPLAFNIKEAYNQTTNYQEKTKLLTLLPRQISTSKIASFIKCSKYIAEKSKIISEREGVYATAKKMVGKQISQDTKNFVEQFYLRDDVSRPMPGMNDVVSVRCGDGTRVKKTKRLLLGL